MPFDLYSACASFQKLLDAVLGPEMDSKAFAYLADIIIVLGKSWEEHKSNLKTVFRKFRHAKLVPNPEKCAVFQTSLKYLGHVVSEYGISTDPDKVKAIQDMSPPTSVRGLRRLLRVASWYRKFVPAFTRICY